ncbi:hypothetical protein F0H33_18545 [Xanthomonas translucens pv. undulosa]|nr:hypothetical protein F0H33_18545 [Xanthomonas translucens pv. undulosa]QEO27943.1 hypothetical protein F0H32_18775 [Xanthomonas translucens pv. undulosa]
MRELTNEELFLVAGAAAAADVDPSEPSTDFPPVVVNPPPSPPLSTPRNSVPAKTRGLRLMLITELGGR